MIDTSFGAHPVRSKLWPHRAQPRRAWSVADGFAVNQCGRHVVFFPVLPKNPRSSRVMDQSINSDQSARASAGSRPCLLASDATLSRTSFLPDRQSRRGQPFARPLHNSQKLAPVNTLRRHAGQASAPTMLHVSKSLGQSLDAPVLPPCWLQVFGAGIAPDGLYEQINAPVSLSPGHGCNIAKRQKTGGWRVGSGRAGPQAFPLPGPGEAASPSSLQEQPHNDQTLSSLNRESALPPPVLRGKIPEQWS